MNDATATSGPGRYADVNGLRLYCEVHGTGAPLVLLSCTVASPAWPCSAPFCRHSPPPAR
jgi:hypothetical protein